MLSRRSFLRGAGSLLAGVACGLELPTRVSVSMGPAPMLQGFPGSPDWCWTAPQLVQTPLIVLSPPSVDFSPVTGLALRTPIDMKQMSEQLRAQIVTMRGRAVSWHAVMMTYLGRPTGQPVDVGELARQLGCQL